MTSGLIAFYMHDLSGGGVERMRLTLIAELRARGVDVCLIVGQRSGALAGCLPPDLHVVDLQRSGMLRAVYPLARVLRRLRPTFLVASLDHNNVSALLAGLLAFSGTRVIACQHNALSAERQLGWKYRVIPWLYWLLQRSAAGFVAVSQGVADDMCRTAGIARARVTTIYNPVIDRRFSIRASAGPPDGWFADGGPPTILFAGRLTAQKDPDLLLQAFARLARMCAARLVVLGEGPLRDSLQHQACALGIADRVLFAGYQLDPVPWIRHAACLVLSSRYEGLGNVLIEALACGTPVVSTNCPFGPSEILCDGQFGTLVPVGDPERMASALLCVLRSKPDRAALRARAEAFTDVACADAHLALFDRLRSLRLVIPDRLEFDSPKTSSPFLQKRTKKLLFPQARRGERPDTSTEANKIKAFCFFFSKKKALPKHASITRPVGMTHGFGLLLSEMGPEQIVGQIMQEPQCDGPNLVVTPNIDHIRLLRRRDFARAYRAARVICPDGWPVLAYARLRGSRLCARVTGCDIFRCLAEHRMFGEKTVCIVVESSATRTALHSWAKQRRLGKLHVVEAPFAVSTSRQAQEDLSAAIRVACPDILVMTLGAPTSEEFLIANRARLPDCWALCVGQAVRVYLNLVDRAPPGWQHLGLEWLWRLAHEPRRLALRYVHGIAWYPIAILLDLAGMLTRGDGNLGADHPSA